MNDERTYRLPARVGFKFTPWGTDAVGVVTGVTARAVQFTYRHDPAVRHSMSLAEFTTRFAKAA